jgi:NTP pyrophosphatase (non-canonical NTP hydrolase)
MIDAYNYTITQLTELCYARSKNAGWHTDLTTGEPPKRNLGEMLMLMNSELVEAFEGERKNLMDDKLPHRKMAEVELADCLIRIFDYAGMRGYDLSSAITEKLEYNLNREDHKIENRVKENGKKF